jgi:hypothetical protein
MDGSSHYKEAEELLALFMSSTRSDPISEPDQVLQAAQVHATLALAAATALPHLDFRGGNKSGHQASEAWREVIV